MLATSVIGHGCVSGLHIAAVQIAIINLIFVDGWGPRYWVPFSILVTVSLAVASARLWHNAEHRIARRQLGWVGLLLCVNLAWYVAQFERQPYSTTGPWRELAELFETVKSSDLRSQAVLTPNPHAFQLITGRPAPMAAALEGVHYEHMVARFDGVPPLAPADAQPVVSVFPWALYKLSQAATAEELLRGIDYSRGISVRPTINGDR
jgi:hypothetical protein